MAQSQLERFRKALAKLVEPALRELGFAGAFPDYTRPWPDRLDKVLFLFDRASDLGINITQRLPDGSCPLQP